MSHPNKQYWPLLKITNIWSLSVPYIYTVLSILVLPLGSAPARYLTQIFSEAKGTHLLHSTEATEFLRQVSWAADSRLTLFSKTSSMLHRLNAQDAVISYQMPWYTPEKLKLDVRDFKEEQNKAHLNYPADFMEKPWVLGETMRQRRLYGDRRNSNRKPSLLLFGQETVILHQCPLPYYQHLVTYIIQGMLLESFLPWRKET